MPEVLRLLTDRFETPIGEMEIAVDEEGRLRAVDWTEQTDRMLPDRMLRILERLYGKNGFVVEPAENPGGVSEMLKRYFAGELASIDELPTETAGTPFQREVWRARCGRFHADRRFLMEENLLRRSDGRARYGQWGWPMGSNPIGVVVPCHRVIRG